MNRRRLIYIIVTLVLSAFLLTLVAPRASKFSYEYKKGSIWKYETLFAKFDFPVLKSEAQIMEEKAGAQKKLIPYYKYSEEVVSNSLKKVESLNLMGMSSAISQDLKSIYAKGVVSDEGVRKDSRQLNSDVLYIQRDKRAIKVPSSEVYKLSDARRKLFSDLEHKTSIALDSLLRAQGVYDLIVPNLVYDEQTTNLVNSDAVNSISPTLGYVNAGQLIVSNGEIVTAEVAQILDSYKKEYEANVGYSGPVFLYWLGNFFVAILILAILCFIIFFTGKTIFLDNRFYYILFIFTLTSVVSLLVIRIDESWFIAVPFTLAALYLQAFVKEKVIVPVYVVSLLPMLIYSGNGVPFYVMYLVAGILSIYLFRFFGRGWTQFIVAGASFLVLAFGYLSFSLIDLIDANVWISLGKLLLASGLSVAGYPLIFLFEKMFKLVSNACLIELCDTSNPLLRELESKAPGTFQHSLQVMNMADSAARAIDANVLLVRAGALYHDIGKMVNPQCFVENESLMTLKPEEKYHYGIPASQSAKDIISHVKNGMEIAKKKRLPSVVVDFICTHQGTTLTSFFWNKYLVEGGDPSQQEDFRYPGPRPRSKEQMILMLCDSIEAASRSLEEHTPEAYSIFVEKIVSGKMNDGQFNDSDLSIKELGIVKDAIKKYIINSHHERVAYPAERHGSVTDMINNINNNIKKRNEHQKITDR